MPRPPVLETIVWSEVHAAGKAYNDWLALAEDAERRDRMEEDRRALSIPAPLRAWLAALARPVHVLAIAEDWCGDVVRHVPVLQALEDAAEGKLRVRYLARADRPELFCRFLTNGGEAIPKFVFLTEAFVECGNWGPMPESGKRLIARGKAIGDVGAARKRVALLYEADPDRGEVIDELCELIDRAAATAL